MPVVQGSEQDYICRYAQTLLCLIILCTEPGSQGSTLGFALTLSQNKANPANGPGLDPGYLHAREISTVESPPCTPSRFGTGKRLPSIMQHCSHQSLTVNNHPSSINRSHECPTPGAQHTRHATSGASRHVILREIAFHVTLAALRARF